MYIDINSDIGESFGRYKIGNDEKIMQYLDSINVACGLHAGDPQIMRKTVQIAKKYKIKIGAHPSYPDLQGFGRRSMKMKREELINFIIYQIGALSGFLKIEGEKLSHIKPHGALYNDASKNKDIAEAIGEAVLLYNKNLPIVGLSKSIAIDTWKKMRLHVKEEVFADRNYEDDGTLVSRNKAYALIHDPKKVAKRVLKMIREKKIETITGKYIETEFNTICIHGDTEGALEMLINIRKLFNE